MLTALPSKKLAVKIETAGYNGCDYGNNVKSRVLTRLIKKHTKAFSD